MQKFVYTALAILTLLFLASCDDGTVDGGPVDNPSDNSAYYPLVPLTIGNSWFYTRTIYDGNGAQVGDPMSFTQQVLRDTTYDNIPGVMMKARSDESFVANKSDGFYAYDDGLIDAVHRMYKYPVIKSDSYYRESGESVIVEDLKRKITVPAGTFECVVLKVLYTDNKYYEVNYFVKGIGLIKTENWALNSQNVYTITSTEVLVSKNF